MQKKIVIGMILFSILLIFAIPKNVKADEFSAECPLTFNKNEGCIYADTGTSISLSDEGLELIQQGYSVLSYACNYSGTWYIYFYYLQNNYNYSYWTPGEDHLDCYCFISNGNEIFTTDKFSTAYMESKIYYTSNDRYGTNSNLRAVKLSNYNTNIFADNYIYIYINKDADEVAHLYTDGSISECEVLQENTLYTVNIKPEPTPTLVPDNFLDKSLKLQNITDSGFYFNGLYYEYPVKAYMDIYNLTEYIVFYDDYNKQLIFVWTFDDILAQTTMKKTGLRWYEYYFELITEPNNNSVLPYCYSVWQINADGTLNCVNSLQNEKSENNHKFTLGWTNPLYEPHMDDYSTFSSYEEYVLNNNIVSSNCDIYNNSGVLIKSAVTLNNSLITPDAEPDTEIGSLKHYLYEKLPIIGTVEVFIKKFNVVLESMKESGEPPEIIMSFDDYYGFGGQVNVLDVSWYEDYREPVKAILSVILIIPFILWIYKKGLPEAIGGI